MARQFPPPLQKRPACTGPIDWKDWPALERDLQNLKDATASAGAVDVFMTSPSPGQIGRFLPNRSYPNDEAYLARLADVMKREYRAIIDAGFVLASINLLPKRSHFSPAQAQTAKRRHRDRRRRSRYARASRAGR